MPAQLSPDLMDLCRAIINRDENRVVALLAAKPSLGKESLATGASRTAAAEFYFQQIAHYLYAGDTPLHAAAAAYQPGIGELLIRHGADVSARNRRGAQPLHYAGGWESSDKDVESGGAGRDDYLSNWRGGGPKFYGQKRRDGAASGSAPTMLLGRGSPADSRRQRAAEEHKWINSIASGRPEHRTRRQRAAGSASAAKADHSASSPGWSQPAGSRRKRQDRKTIH